jgi:8-oxo-dGTP pyrophosphatase MutT (NUDIX family)
VTAGPAPAPRELIDAAVLVPLYRDAEDELRLVLVRRTEGGIHGGQIAFPGGKLDATDGSLRDAALREASEEIGLAPASATVLAELEPLETRVTGFRIHPFLARVMRPERWRIAEREVAEVIEPRVAELADPANRDASMERFPQLPAPVRIDFIRIGPHRLWGATYRILEPLLPKLMAGEWQI